VCGERGKEGGGGAGKEGKGRGEIGGEKKCKEAKVK